MQVGVKDRLPGGLAGIQAITIQDRFFETYRKEVDFIQRYVFPGGMLPSPAVLKSLGERFGIPVIRERIFGEDYARTLAAWREPQPGQPWWEWLGARARVMRAALLAHRDSARIVAGNRPRRSAICLIESPSYSR